MRAVKTVHPNLRTNALIYAPATHPIVRRSAVSKLELKTSPTRVKVKPIEHNAHPCVALIWHEVVDRNLSMKSLGAVSGVDAKTIRTWFKSPRSPNLASIIAVLQALGFELKVEKRGD